MTDSPSKDVSKNSELRARIQTAVIVGAPIAGIMFFAPTPVVGAVVMLLAVIGMYEFDSIFEQIQIKLSLLALLGSAFILGVATILGGSSGLTAALFVVSLGLFFYYLLFLSPEVAEEVQNLGLCLFAIIWVAWSINHITLIRGLEEGKMLLFLFVFIIWISDIAAYFGGKTFGRMPLAPTISPKKTYEGSICGALASGLLSGVFCFFLIHSIGWVIGVGLGVVIALIGQIGDLIESKIKRLCGVKDSGTIFPGHGGVLDRVDGLLTSAPVFYYFIFWIQ